MSEQTHTDRVELFLDAWDAAPIQRTNPRRVISSQSTMDSADPYAKLVDTDLRELVADNKQLERDLAEMARCRDFAVRKADWLTAELAKLGKGDPRANWTYQPGAGRQLAAQDRRPLFSGNVIAGLNNWAGQKRTQAAGWRAGGEARDDSDQRQRHMERADLRDQEAAEIELLAKVAVLLDMDGPLRTALVQAIEAWDVWPAEAPGDSTTATGADQ